MKLSDLTPCAICNGRIAPVFYQVRVSQMMVIPSAVNQTLGVNMVLGGNALGLAEVMSPTGDNVTLELQEQTALVCQDCFLKSELAGVLFEEARPPSLKTSDPIEVEVVPYADMPRGRREGLPDNRESLIIIEEPDDEIY